MSQVQNNILHNVVQPALFLSVAFLAGSKRCIQYFPGATQNGLVLSAALGSGFTLASQMIVSEKETAYHSFMRVTASLALGMIMAPYVAKRLNRRADITFPASFRLGVLETIVSMTLASASYYITSQSVQRGMGVEVGKLQKKWQFPSDHLPIGMTVKGVHIASWNVLNTAFFRWIEKNSQGLKDSMLKEENYPVKDPPHSTGGTYC